MKMKKLLALIATGALAVSCLAITTGCSGDNAIKEAFMQQPRISHPEGYGLVDPQPYEVVDFQYGQDERYEVDKKGIKATVKNNICEQEVFVGVEENNGEYIFSDWSVNPLEVYQPVEQDATIGEYEPDFSAATIESRENDFGKRFFTCKVPLKASWFSNEASYAEYKFEQTRAETDLPTWIQPCKLVFGNNVDNIVGTYKATSDSPIKTVTIKDTGKTEGDEKIYSISYELPSSFTTDYKGKSATISLNTTTVTYETPISYSDNDECIEASENTVTDSIKVSGTSSLLEGDKKMDDISIDSFIKISPDKPELTLNSKGSYEIRYPSSIFGKGEVFIDHSFDFVLNETYVKE